MTVYKNEHGRQLMADWYQTFLERLGDTVGSEHIETELGTTHVLTAGPEDRPPLLCFHGVLGSAPYALSLVRRLIPHFRILFPDTPGQPGRSAETRLPMRGDGYARWAVDVIDGLHLASVPVCGVSMGGFIATKLAAYAPERIASLALWVPGGLVSAGGWSAARLGWASLASYLFPSEARTRQLYDEIYTDYDDTYYRYYRDAMQHVVADRTMPQNAPRGAFDALEAPVFVVAHEHDVVFPAEALIARAHRDFPNLVSAEVIPDWRHVPPFAAGATDAVLDRVREFLLTRPTSDSARDAHRCYP